MRQVTLNRAQKYLLLPLQQEAPLQQVLLQMEETVHSLPLRLAQTAAEQWAVYPLPEGWRGRSLTLSAECGWVHAAYTAEVLPREVYHEVLRPQVHFTPAGGSIAGLCGLQRQQDGWQLTYRGDPAGGEAGQIYAVYSKDLLHWQPAVPAAPAELLPKVEKTCWTGDIDAVYEAEGVQFALSKGLCVPGMPASHVLSLPVLQTEAGVFPIEALQNLRVWQRRWQCETIDKEFHFELRFGYGPDRWPNLKLLPKDGTSDDIRADAAEVVLELQVGKERQITFDWCGVAWQWEALTHTLSCRDHRVYAPVKDGRLVLHWYFDRCLQELFTAEGRAVLIHMEQGIGSEQKARTALVDNVDNDSFDYAIDREPYFCIACEGDTARILSLYVYGLRPVHLSQESAGLLQHWQRGEVLYQVPDYTVYSNAVEDAVYGPPAAYIPDGDTVISPIRVTEEFEWRNTPWGDMTRVADHSEVWHSGQAKACYPTLKCAHPALEAAYNIAIDVLYRNALPEYNLPGQAGLLNAGLFHGKGEGFGVWMRDAAQAAIRTQNLLAPEVMRRTLRYITEKGFDNGDDGAAMPAPAIWDYYVLHKDRQLLFETLPGIVRLAKKADVSYDAEKKLVRANNCPAQDAFPDTEAGGYCMGTEVFYGKMYLAAANICRETEMYPELAEIWAQRGEEILEQVKAVYWNEEAGCFAMGPKGSEAYARGLWEATGAELSVWPRFGIADAAQRVQFLANIKQELSQFGLNWYPFREEQNHFWGSCWVSWTLGIAVAAAHAGDLTLLEQLIFGQVRNCLMNKTFHEVIDAKTGRAWRWPGMVWHASSFVGYFLNACLGISWDAEGLCITSPAVPKALADMQLCGLRYGGAQLDFVVHGWGTQAEVLLDGTPLQGHISQTLQENHKVELYMR